MRAIFDLPGRLFEGTSDVVIKSPLAYIEWFTPFHAKDTSTGMYIISHSTRQHYRHAAIVPITDIVRTCHLIPVWGSEMNCTWNSDNVLDQAKRFILNPYLQHEDFILMRYLVHKHEK